MCISLLSPVAGAETQPQHSCSTMQTILNLVVNICLREIDPLKSSWNPPDLIATLSLVSHKTCCNTVALYKRKIRIEQRLCEFPWQLHKCVHHCHSKALSEVDSIMWWRYPRRYHSLPYSLVMNNGMSLYLLQIVWEVQTGLSFLCLGSWCLIEYNI